MAGVGTIPANTGAGPRYGMETDAAGGNQVAANPLQTGNSGTIAGAGTAAAPAATTATANPLQPAYLPTPPTAQATTYQNLYDPSTGNQRTHLGGWSSGSAAAAGAHVDACRAGQSRPAQAQRRLPGRTSTRLKPRPSHLRWSPHRSTGLVWVSRAALERECDELDDGAESSEPAAVARVQFERLQQRRDG